MVGVDPSIPVDTLVHCVPNVLGQQDQITVYYQTGTTSPLRILVSSLSESVDCRLVHRRLKTPHVKFFIETTGI